MVRHTIKHIHQYRLCDSQLNHYKISSPSQIIQCRGNVTREVAVDVSLDALFGKVVLLYSRIQQQ